MYNCNFPLTPAFPQSPSFPPIRRNETHPHPTSNLDPSTRVHSHRCITTRGPTPARTARPTASCPSATVNSPAMPLSAANGTHLFPRPPTLSAAPLPRASSIAAAPTHPRAQPPRHPPSVFVTSCRPCLARHAARPFCARARRGRTTLHPAPACPPAPPPNARRSGPARRGLPPFALPCPRWAGWPGGQAARREPSRVCVTAGKSDLPSPATPDNAFNSIQTLLTPFSSFLTCAHDVGTGKKPSYHHSTSPNFFAFCLDAFPHFIFFSKACLREQLHM